MLYRFALLAALLLALACSEQDPEARLASMEPDDFPGKGPLVASEVEKWVIRYTNSSRLKAGKHPLEHDPAISDIARQHSEQMAVHGLRHRIAGKSPTDRALEAGYDCEAVNPDGSRSYGLGENISEHPRVQFWHGDNSGWSTKWEPVVYDYDAREAAHRLVERLMDSPGHRRNMLDSDYHRVGVGVAVDVQIDGDGKVMETLFSTQNFSSCR